MVEDRDMSYQATEVVTSSTLTPTANHIRTSHGILMAIVFLGLKPSGAILLRVLSGRAAFKIHVSIQCFALICAGAGVGLGIWLANTMGRFGKQHPIIGFVVLACMIVQPLLGYWHHTLYKRVKSRTWIGVIHTWLGRLMIILGIINGGIGLGDADNTTAGMVVYIVIAALDFSAYLALLFLLRYKEAKQLKWPYGILTL